MSNIPEAVLRNAQEKIWQARTDLIDICETYDECKENFDQITKKKEVIVEEVRQWGNFLQEHDPKAKWIKDVEKWIKSYA